ncbi:MAG TPA: malto-oligosyltrehalose trehalohydrolase [Anaeromyxobacter sp.]|nr:malto-oligosyltrehalose trehalohydrolase [Anaeromyxobacter sp.]
MRKLGHTFGEDGRSAFRVFAPAAGRVTVAILDGARTVALARDELGYWTGATARLPPGTRYLLECDGRRLPDPASRSQPEGVHGPSAVAEVERVERQGWRGVAVEDAIVYELHVGTFTPAGTLSAAAARLPDLQALGATVIELLPLAAFPGERNWGYDGTYPFALHAAYGGYRDLRQLIEAAHRLGMAVILDVVFNHFGPEGNYSGTLAPYTRRADTPWGAAVNFDGEWSHGVRELFLANARYWLEEVGFDGFRMDAVSAILDGMPVHILRECTELARRIGAAEGREVLMIAEHLRNDRRVTADDGFAFHAQWNDDLGHAIFACLTGERRRHHANFGPLEDVVKALTDAFVLDGTRLDRYHHYLLGSDGRATRGREHVVYLQNHDQVGNRPRGDRMIASYGRAKALLGITTVMASPYVPLLFMGEEYGETAPFLFFEDFSDPRIVAGAREGRRAALAVEGGEPPDPHARATFEASKLRWERRETTEGRAILGYYQALIALKRAGELGPRDRGQLAIAADVDRRLLRLETPHTLTLLNYSGEPRAVEVAPGWRRHLDSLGEPDGPGLGPFGARVYRRG